jgi:hypothetical protein
MGWSPVTARHDDTGHGTIGAFAIGKPEFTLALPVAGC